MVLLLPKVLKTKGSYSGVAWSLRKLNKAEIKCIHCTSVILKVEGFASTIQKETVLSPFTEALSFVILWDLCFKEKKKSIHLLVCLLLVNFSNPEQ